MKDTVSIIAPAYNHEKYIVNAISSIAQQTYYNKELIVIDDCSNDKTAELIEKYTSIDIVKEVFPLGIKFIKHTKNQNAHRTINEGIRLSQGEYISIINTDDCYEPERIEVMLNVLKANNARFAFSKVECIDENDNKIENPLFTHMEKALERLPSPVFELVIENASIGTGNYFFEKKLFEEVGGFSEEYHFIHDWDYILKCALISEPVYVNETSYKYRFHETNTIKQIDENVENTQKKDREVYNVLMTFLKRLLRQDVENNMLKNLEVWNYYFEKNSSYYCSYLWKELKQYG